MIREVHLDPATDQEIEAVREAFRVYGFDTDVKADYLRRSTGVLPWIISITLATPITAFFAAFGAAAGQDAYTVVKTWVKALRASRESSPANRGFLEIEDSDSTRVIITSDLPDEALDALFELDWDEHRGEYLTWDDESGRWQDPMSR